MSVFEQIKLENPVAATLFVYLRHECNPDLMDTSGYVPLSTASRELGYSSGEILDSMDSFNQKRRPHQQMTVDDNGSGCVIVKANTCHSISKVNANLPYIPGRWSRGFIFLRSDSAYQPGDDVFPSGRRNEVVIRLSNSRPGRHLVIDLWRLASYTPLFQFDSTGCFARDIIPSSCITHKRF